MEITLAEQLTKLRKQKGNTQEELANHLGVTFQAVSKWERNEGFPDITLLPAIAFYYGVHVDDLLGVGEQEKERKIDAYCKQEHELMHQGKVGETIALWREAQKEFPNEMLVLYRLMEAMWIENCKQHAEEIISCGERILKETTDHTLRYGAIEFLCRTTTYALGDREKAKTYARMLPGFYQTKNMQLARVFEGEKAIGYCQGNISALFDLIWCNVVIMSQNGLKPEDEIADWKFVLDCFNLLYPDGQMGFSHSRVSEVSRTLARKYKELGKVDEMLSYLNHAAEHAVKFDTYEEITFAVPILNLMTDSPDRNTQTFEGNFSGLLFKELTGDGYAAYRDDPRILAILEKLKPVAVL